LKGDFNDKYIMHPLKDNIEIVDCSKLVEISKALARFIRRI
jgi:hypothetical protein